MSCVRFFRGLIHRPFCYGLANKLMKFLRHAEGRSLTYRFKSCGGGVDLYSPVYITAPEHVSVGERVSFAPFVHIWGEGGVEIGNRVMIGSHTAITSLTHDYTKHRMQETLIKRPIVIEDDAWIGSHAVIMPGVTIGRGAVVGAGAVVTKDVDRMAIVTGVPAAVLKKRPTWELPESRLRLASELVFS